MHSFCTQRWSFLIRGVEREEIGLTEKIAAVHVPALRNIRPKKRDATSSLVTRIRLASEEAASRFFGQYSEALEKKHEDRSNLFRQTNFFSFNTPDGGVFLRCVQKECITLEGGDGQLFQRWSHALGWPPLPGEPQKPTTPVTTL